MPTYTRPAPFPKMDGSQPCRRDPDLFTPDQPEGEEAKRAASICRDGCPFIEQCFAYGVTHVVSGVYGGMTPRQRQTWRRKHGMLLLDTGATVGADGEESGPRVSPGSDCCTKGHPRTPENAYKNPKGGWECRPCRRAADARRKDARKTYYAQRQSFLGKRREYAAAARARAKSAPLGLTLALVSA